MHSYLPLLTKKEFRYIRIYGNQQSKNKSVIRSFDGINNNYSLKSTVFIILFVFTQYPTTKWPLCNSHMELWFLILHLDFVHKLTMFLNESKNNLNDQWNITSFGKILFHYTNIVSFILELIFSNSSNCWCFRSNKLSSNFILVLLLI